LPTSLISLNVSRAAWNGQKVTGKPSAPHGIELVKGGFISEGILISIRFDKHCHSCAKKVISNHKIGE
jgi:hypothetical protein